MSSSNIVTNDLHSGGQCTQNNDENDDGDGGTSSTSCRWLAIPYAEPLPKRFAPSVPRKHHNSIPEDEANNINDGYGPECYQWDNVKVTSNSQQSEDCLTLNIWAPNDDDNNNNKNNILKPVMVFIPGGGFVIGSASTSLASYGIPGADSTIKMYDGAKLAARQNVVVVVIQYRLGPFGFLPMWDEKNGNNNNNNTTTITTTTTGGANGIGDQISALQWVQMHITKFGGDPTKVTLFGHSAGSVSVCNLLHSPLAKGLFHRVIMQSGSCYPSIIQTLTKEEAYSLKDEYLQKLKYFHANDGNGDDYTFDIRTAPPDEIIRRTLDIYGSDWKHVFLSGLGAPNVDGAILPELPIHLTPQAGVDIMIGITSFDQTVSSIPGGREAFLSTFGLLLDSNDPSDVAKTILESYVNNDDTNLFLDACLRCQSQRVLERAIETSSSSSSGEGHYYWYTFDCPKSTALHGTDIVTVFGNIDRSAYATEIVQKIFGPPPSEDLIQRMQEAWGAFAWSGSISGWEDVSDGGGMGAFIGCDATLVRPHLMDTYGSCDIWTSFADAVGPFTVASICIQDSYIDGGKGTGRSSSSDQQPSDNTQTLFVAGAIIVVAFCLAASIARLFYNKRRAGYSPIQESTD